MKIIYRNSDLVFQKSATIEKSVSKSFAASAVGSEGTVVLELDTPIKPNMTCIVKVTGTSGVVANDTWNIRLNGNSSKATPSMIVTNGDSVQFTINGVVTSVVLQRSQIAASGDITLSAKYSDNPDYVQPAPISEDVDINSTTTTQTLVLDEAIAAPCLIGVKMIDKLGSSTSLACTVATLDANDNVIMQNVNIISNNTYVWVLNATAVKKIRLTRAGSANTTFTVTVSVP